MKDFNDRLEEAVYWMSTIAALMVMLWVTGFSPVNIRGAIDAFVIIAVSMAVVLHVETLWGKWKASGKTLRKKWFDTVLVCVCPNGHRTFTLVNMLDSHEELMPCAYCGDTLIPHGDRGERNERLRP